MTTHHNIIGISGGYHDSACCLLRDGQLVAAAQEERFTRIKNDPSYPLHALRFCLDKGGITLADVDCIAYYEDPAAKLGRQLWMSSLTSTSRHRHDAFLRRLLSVPPEKFIREVIGYDGDIEYSEHHLSHAASAYFYSGFRDASILTVDGVGEWSSTSYAVGSNTEIKKLRQVDFPDSLGLFYSALTAYLGFEVNEGEYKVMGLAPYGAPNYVKDIRKIIAGDHHGAYRLDLKYFRFLSDEAMYSDALIEMFGTLPRQPHDPITSFHMDVARSAQAVLEEILLDSIRYLYTVAPNSNLCLAGGVALNVVANRRCLREGPFRKLFVQPAAGDAGGALGAAAVAHFRRNSDATHMEELVNVYVGPEVKASDVKRILTDASVNHLNFAGRLEELVAFTAKELADGRIVGWCQGRMEFGPRALGARSILADARRTDMKERINAIIKLREGFRPFAPAVLLERAPQHFELDYPSPFMLQTCNVCSPISLPAITHVDNSARVQTVDADINPRFASLLLAFERLTDCPILLNTSFNMRGEPIVCSALDAINCFVRSNLDLLVIDDYVIRRGDIPKQWELSAHLVYEGGRKASTVSDYVYTFL